MFTEMIWLMIFVIHIYNLFINKILRKHVLLKNSRWEVQT